MKTILYRGNDTSAVGNTNPLPVQNYRDSDSFDVAFSSENAVSGNIVKTATSGKSIYITDLIISSQHAGQVWLQDSDGTMVTKIFYMAANGNISHTWNTPKKVVASKNLLVKTTGNMHFTLDIAGYIA